jgi:hypothetical protein
MLPLSQQIDLRLSRLGGDDDEEEEAAAAERERVKKTLLDRPKPEPLDIDEFMRTLPKRRYTRRKPDLDKP